MAALGKLDQRLVRFNTDGGSAIPDTMITKGQMLTAPAEPIKAGFLFVGWFTDSNKTTAFDFETPINEDTTLYAKWVRLGLEFSLANRLYTAVFDGENKSSITVHYDADFSTLGVEDIAFSNPKSANQKINKLSFDLEKNQLTVNATVGGTTADYTISLEVTPPQDKYYIVPQKGPVQSQIVAYDIKVYIVNDNESLFNYFETNDPTILETDYKKSVLVIDKSDTELQRKDIIVFAAGLNAEGKYVGSGKETFNLDNEVRKLEIPFKRTPNSFELMSDIREWYMQNVNNDNDLKAGISLSVEIPSSGDMSLTNVNLHYFREYLATNRVFSILKYSPFYRGKKPAYGSISNGNLVIEYHENSFLPNGDWAVGVQNSRFYLNATNVADPVVVGEYEEGDDVVAKLVWR